VVHHGIEDAMQQRDGAFGQNLQVPRRVVAKVGQAFRMAIVNRDEVVGSDEEVDVVRAEAVLISSAESDAVEDDVEIPVVRLDLRVLPRRQRILDRQRMERERGAQEERFRDRRRREIDPDERAGCRIQPGAIQTRRLPGLAVPMNEDRDQPSLLP
jgi:hypothetical protein